MKSLFYSFVFLISLTIISVVIENRQTIKPVELSTSSVMSCFKIPTRINAMNNTVHNTLRIPIILFFILEKFIHWRHCHHAAGEDHPHAFSYVILFGDVVHNFVDGMIIAAGSLADLQLGMATALAVAFHEIPQKIGDFGSLIYGGFSRRKALIYNFLSSLTAFGGVILVLLFMARIS